VPPTKIITTVCSAPLSWHLLLNLVADSIILMIITTVVPSTAAGIVSGTVGLGLTHAFEAMYIANTLVKPMLGGMQTISSRAIRAFGGNDGSLDARLRANESHMPPEPPADSPEPRSPREPGSIKPTGPNDSTRVLDAKLTRPIGDSNGRPSGPSSTTATIGSNGNGKGTTTIGASTKGIAKI
jgi:hypothetical protein